MERDKYEYVLKTRTLNRHARHDPLSANTFVQWPALMPFLLPIKVIVQLDDDAEFCMLSMVMAGGNSK
eukprot:5405448-Karenia_brevis.AAC.1